MYHTLIYQRRGMKVNAVVDDDAPVVAEIMGTGLWWTIQPISEIRKNYPMKGAVMLE